MVTSMNKIFKNKKYKSILHIIIFSTMISAIHNLYADILLLDIVVVNKYFDFIIIMSLIAVLFFCELYFSKFKKTGLVAVLSIVMIYFTGAANVVIEDNIVQLTPFYDKYKNCISQWGEQGGALAIGPSIVALFFGLLGGGMIASIANSYKDDL